VSELDRERDAACVYPKNFQMLEEAETANVPARLNGDIKRDIELA